MTRQTFTLYSISRLKPIKILFIAVMICFLIFSGSAAVWEPSNPLWTPSSHLHHSISSPGSIFYIYWNQLVHMSISDSWMYLYFCLVDYLRYVFYFNLYPFYVWPIHLNLFILIKYTKSRSANMLSNSPLLPQYNSASMVRTPCLNVTSQEVVTRCKIWLSWEHTTWCRSSWDARAVGRFGNPLLSSNHPHCENEPLQSIKNNVIRDKGNGKHCARAGRHWTRVTKLKHTETV